MAIYEIKNEDDQKEKDFDDDEEEDDRCSCCCIPYDQCSWGQADEWDDEEEDDDDSQINDPNYRPEEDEYSYSDSEF